MSTSRIDLQLILEEAEDAFWQVIGRHYPETTTGDLSPGTTMDLRKAQEAAVKEWIWGNSPASDDTTT